MTDNRMYVNPDPDQRDTPDQSSIPHDNEATQEQDILGSDSEEDDEPKKRV